MKIEDFIKICHDEKSAWDFIRRKQWPNSITCLSCDSNNISLYKDSKLPRYRCNRCGRHFSLLSNTPLRHFHIAPHALLQCIFSLELGISVRQTARNLQINSKTVMRIKAKKEGLSKFLFENLGLNK